MKKTILNTSKNILIYKAKQFMLDFKKKLLILEDSDNGVQLGGIEQVVAFFKCDKITPNCQFSTNF